MHRALTIREFIEMVVDEDTRPFSLADPTLLALALTCRTFQEPALDMLWASQYGLGHLVQCLPEDLWTYSDNSMDSVTLREPTRATTQQDWQRFDVYARRVRRLHHEDDPHVHIRLKFFRECHVSGPLFRWLLSSRPSHQLLPSLSFLGLGWTEDTSSKYYDSAHTLFGPRLTELDISTPRLANTNVLNVILLHLPLRSPDVQSLRANESRYRESDCQPIPTGILPALKGLEKFGGSIFLTFDSLAGLSTLPNLTEATLLFDKQRAIGQLGTEGTAQTLTFRALERLTTRMTTMADAEALLSVCCFPRLQEISLTTTFESNSGALDGVLRLIHDRCEHAILESIQIRSGANEHLADVVHDITAASFRRLYDFRHLRKFGLNTKMRIILDDDAVEEMAKSWPRLEYLHFRSPPTSATLEGLAHLARYCPSLSSLCIDVQTRGTVVSADVIPGGGFCNRALEEIEFCMSFPYGNEAKIAAFLNAIFPNIRRLDWVWRRVWDIILVLRMASEWEKHASK
ncbi:uncharacterized protein B0H18DRAFT_636572 [Fomitopsis serialis]|uniref:uncharacterized protein n=1 Tax=Fomitopsis serialis TaxID=139415 RepID=UPI0020082AEA|nr:uncharacterized protein B0H18DRAFT_636572 [Neoantrodia serialis]KAH9919410.1 hypothetical protein B0H18DRAFT_636572 [Neoantrodia serialis]